ncbi:MAG: substrate-binding domain-containing protein [Gemmataceae bacterium]
MKRLLMSLFLAAILTCLASCGSGNGKHGTKIGFMPKLAGIPYFNACKKGAEEAAQELNLDLKYDGPNKADVSQQNDLLDQWINSGDYACICVACNDPNLIASNLRQAQDKGIHVITFDADTMEDARAFFVNQATYEDVAYAMVDALAEDLGDALKDAPGNDGNVKVAILTSYKTAPNQSEWASRIKTYVAKKYPRIELLEETEHGEDRDEGIKKAKALIEGNRDLRGILGLTSVAVPAAAEAVRQEGKKGKIKVTGVSTPKDMRDYVLDGTVNYVILWNPIDLGYLTVYVADLERKGQMPKNGVIEAGRLGKITVRDGEVLLGKPLKFTKENIDKYGF